MVPSVISSQREQSIFTVALGGINSQGGQRVRIWSAHTWLHVIHIVSSNHKETISTHAENDHYSIPNMSPDYRVCSINASVDPYTFSSPLTSLWEIASPFQTPAQTQILLSDLLYIVTGQKTNTCGHSHCRQAGTLKSCFVLSLDDNTRALLGWVYAQPTLMLTYAASPCVTTIFSYKLFSPCKSCCG